jgi:hypothetical protein
MLFRFIYVIVATCIPFYALPTIESIAHGSTPYFIAGYFILAAGALIEGLNK